MALPHPRLQTRDLPRELPSLRVLIYAPRSTRETWIVSEISRLEALVQVGRNLENVIAALVEDPPPRPAVLVVDFDQMDGGEMLQLHTVREQGWCGVVIGLGMIPLPLRSSLGIERVISMPASDGMLSDAIGHVGFHAQTVRIPVRRDTSTMTAFATRASNARVITRPK